VGTEDHPFLPHGAAIVPTQEIHGEKIRDGPLVELLHPVPIAVEIEVNVIGGEEKRGRATALDQDRKRVGEAILETIVERDAKVSPAYAGGISERIDGIVERNEIAPVSHGFDLLFEVFTLVVEDDVIIRAEYPIVAVGQSGGQGEQLSCPVANVIMKPRF
jgi:hypothetical protein